ncbi:M16 family metallopeptidase [Aquabacterium sp.]|uniref:M16 family metallopeptidase n=1 Tax=Aquabacterium sp. TaxID=1872578 RepID=UPI002C865EE9|nr:pitrilysin family protein [Aquabacterium sp.]HSW07164.1 pitrilysin family protein [Aquabacterium sp.]
MKRRPWFSVALCIVPMGIALMGIALSAQAATPGADAPPLPQPPRPVVVPAFDQHTLPNGLTLVVAPRHEAPVVTIALLVRAGPELDPAGRSGTAAMTAGLLTKGARRGGRAVSATELARQAEALGGTLEAASGWRSSTVAMTVTTPKLDAAAALVADVVRQPTLAAAELERARAQSLDGLRVTMGDPGAVAGMVARRAFWGDSAYGSVATVPSIKRITRTDVQAFHAAAYRPERAVLVLAGDIEAPQAQALAKKLFGPWRGAANAATTPRPTTPSALAQPLVLIDMPGSGQSGVVVAAPFVASGAGDRRAGQVANAVLGGGYSARLNQEVRIKRGLSYGAFSEAETHPASGMAQASTQTSHPNAAQVLQLVRGEIDRLAETPPTAEELAARQATLIGSFARRLETTGGLASLVVAQLVQGRPLDDLQRSVDEIMAVTPAQVQGFARQHWQAKTLRGVIAGDLKAAGDALTALPGSALRVPVESLDLDQPSLTRP